MVKRELDNKDTAIYGDKYYPKLKPGVLTIDSKYHKLGTTELPEMPNLDGYVKTESLEDYTTKAEFSPIESQVENLEGEIASLTSRVDTLENKVEALEGLNSTLQSNLSGLESRIEALENPEE